MVLLYQKRELATTLIKDSYSTALHKDAPLKLEVLYNENLRGELEFLRERWAESGRGDPQIFQGISDMMRESFEKNDTT